MSTPFGGEYTDVTISRENYRALVRDANRYRWIEEAKFVEIVTEDQMFRTTGEGLGKVIDTAATP